ncbi:hypothetical protein BDV95DRAFT_590234 [Massariosphaeria phaeospora]|uniref:Uncharacterized protein n=1 Tax=Massariosphaeria phaeospora TaxID=100035 RepID=A0A7C8MKF4_9PLEO|nr:hypothetical protein BDV95DRAFT_590234 [Massariosphaeria phaeospora]
MSRRTAISTHSFSIPYPVPAAYYSLSMRRSIQATRYLPSQSRNQEEKTWATPTYPEQAPSRDRQRRNTKKFWDERCARDASRRREDRRHSWPRYRTRAPTEPALPDFLGPRPPDFLTRTWAGVKKKGVQTWDFVSRNKKRLAAGVVLAVLRLPLPV